jgi:DNA polymerase-3 subunit alpha
LNRVALEAMVKAGALSPLDRNPARLYEHIDGGLVFADNMIKSKQAGQDSLFFSESASSPDSFNTVYPELPQIDKWSRTQTLAFEKDVMGVYLSDHPLKGLELDIEAQSTHTCAVIEELEDQSRIQIAGVIAGLRTSITKSKGEKMANIILEDFSGQCSVTIFPATYAKFQEQIRKDTVVKVSGVIMHSQRFSGVGEKRIEVRAEEIAPLEINQGSVETDDDDSFLGHVTINISRASRTQLESLREVIEASPGSFRLRLRIGTNGSTQVLTLMHPVDNSDEFVQKVKDSVFGCKVAVVEHTAYNVSREPAGAR